MSAPCAPRAVNFSETTTFALDVARQAADLVMRVLPESPTAKQVAYKGPTDLVTRADRESEQLIAARIRERFPDHGLLAEEGTTGPGGAAGTGKSARWRVDPSGGAQ